MKHQQADMPLGRAEIADIGSAFAEAGMQMMKNPLYLWKAWADLGTGWMDLWGKTWARALGGEAQPAAIPDEHDRRFRDSAWQDSAVFDFIKQSYLLTSRWMMSTIRNVEGLDDRTEKKVLFYTRQFMDALSPSNFIMTNPEVLRATLESGGENLVLGLRNLLKDLERGKGRLSISRVDEKAFRLGENIAVTPGKVIWRNDLMELIQYAPATETVMQRPLLVIPPWINKYYILDMRPENSFIKCMVEQGITVFVISWVNPDRHLAKKTFDDYLTEGALEAMDRALQVTGEKDLNVMGYCLGGTLLACALSWLEAKGRGDQVKSATFLTTLVDFEEAGELSVFIDEVQLEALERRMKKSGYLDAGSMASTFNMLRANDLIWTYVVNNYLLGKAPFPFDLLSWNADSTRMPAAMHSFYLRNMYQKNLLSRPGGITLDGVPMDLGRIRSPSFILATKEDHIAPWISAYVATQLYSGPCTFRLAMSGHIAGIVNPPNSGKYGYWENTDLPPSPEKWLEHATFREGSWWPGWLEWLKPFGGDMVRARIPGKGKLKALDDAPGQYVRVRSH
ncbi:MAG: class I poly(R)-hydroxyalkanoic acid synthase [Pseudomonadota bacterium]|nr:class I poly(R)-hydroxyalkanoic acid synthase [Pseudomonadota bacterium]